MTNVTSFGHNWRRSATRMATSGQDDDAFVRMSPITLAGTPATTA